MLPVPSYITVITAVLNHLYHNDDDDDDDDVQ